MFQSSSSSSSSSSLFLVTFELSKKKKGLCGNYNVPEEVEGKKGKE